MSETLMDELVRNAVKVQDRKDFAKAAMQGLLATGVYTRDIYYIVDLSIEYADALIERLDKKE